VSATGTDARSPIRFFNRYSGRIEEEVVYGDAWLRWAYGTMPGRLSLHVLAKRAFFSRWYGWRMDQPASRARIAPFLREFGLDPAEFADPPDSFRTFNEFFYRRLKPSARPMAPSPDAIVFPADGRHLGFARLSATDSFFVKGQRFDLRAFLRDDALARRYDGGAAVFSRLCPVDYHRFHFPVAGRPSEVRRIEGWLWSVSPIALRQNLAILWENRRWLCEIESERAGKVLMAEIGATNVGSAVHSFRVGGEVAKGDEKGYFRFGGSAVLTLFEPGRVELAEDLIKHSAAGLELYTHMGDRLGRVTPP
jgi:phosphatidylserine decarboxylase